MNKDSGPNLYSVRANDPQGELIDRSSIDPEAMDQIDQIMRAFGRLRQVEKEMSEASQRYMKLKATDMRALHYLMVQENAGEKVSPSQLALHLKITTASITKLLDRLEAGGHIERNVHPQDRRALLITVTPSTRAEAMQTVGRQQARRFKAAAMLSSQEREIVIGFLNQMTADLSEGMA